MNNYSPYTQALTRKNNFKSPPTYPYTLRNNTNSDINTKNLEQPPYRSLFSIILYHLQLTITLKWHINAVIYKEKQSHNLNNKLSK